MLSRTAAWVVIAVLAFTAIWLWPPDHLLSSPSTVAEQALANGPLPAAAATPPPRAAEPEPVRAAPHTASPDAPPPGLTAQAWATVLQRLEGQPDAVAERQRLAAYFGWADAVQRWRAAPTDAALARQVDAGLSDRLAQREVSAAEARQLKLALLQTLAPDDASRVAALQAFDAALPAPAAPDPRRQAFSQAQAAALSAWQAQPVDQRDPQALARELAALRQTHFKNPTHTEEPR